MLTPGRRIVPNRIFQDYDKKYTALERRHTRHTRDDQGHVHIIIEPFVDEMHAMALQLQAELGGVVDQRIAPPPPEKGMVHTALPLFRQAGEAKLTMELWKNAKGGYEWKQDAQWVNGPSSSTGYSGRTSEIFPAEYRLCWAEAE